MRADTHVDKQIARTVQRLLKLRNAGDEVLALEAELNRRVYGLFELNEDDVRIVEREKG